MTQTPATTPPQSGTRPLQLKQTAAPVALSFFALGFLSLLATLLIGLAHPAFFSGDPYRPGVLALTHLILLGFIGSLVFGASYMILPVIAASSLWSRKLAWIHFTLHAIGMTWMVAAMAHFNFLEAMQGGNAVFLGMMLYVINLILTASRRNQWEPAHISFMTGLFWLCLASGLAIIMLVNKFVPLTDHNPQWLISLHAHLGLVGFFWLVLLGAALKLFSMFLISSKSPGLFSWLGLITINAGMMLMIPLEFNRAGSALQPVAQLILLGSCFYLVDIVRLFTSSSRRLDGSMATAGVGILLGLLTAIWIVAGMPSPSAEASQTLRENVRTYFVLTLFGTYLFATLGMGTRIIPFLAWQIRYAPHIGKAKLPTASDLAHPESRWIMLLCLTIGWCYLAYAQLTAFLPGVQLGLACILVGFGWFIYTVSPAAKAVFAHGPGSSKPSHEQR